MPAAAWKAHGFELSLRHTSFAMYAWLLFSRHTLPAVIGPLGGDGPVGKMNPGGLLGLLLDPLVVLPYPGLLFLKNEVDA